MRIYSISLTDKNVVSKLYQIRHLVLSCYTKRHIVTYFVSEILQSQTVPFYIVIRDAILFEYEIILECVTEII